MATIFRSLGLLLLALGGAVLAVLQFRDEAYRLVGMFFTINRDSFDNITDYTIIFAIALYVVVAPLILLLYKFLELLRLPDISQFFDDFNVTPCTLEDLEDIFILARRQFGEQSSDRPAIHRLFKHTPGSFWKIHSDRIVGYFIIFSLTKAGEQAILNGHYNGASPDARYLNRNIKRGRVACVGAVVGEGTKGRGAAFGGLTTALGLIGVKRVYARAVTSDGLKKIKDFHFTRVDGSQELELKKYYVLDIPEFVQSMNGDTARKTLTTLGPTIADA